MKSFELELNLYIPETVVVIRKSHKKYVVSNISPPYRIFTFDTKEEVFNAIGSAKRGPRQFRDLTHENLFIGTAR